MSPSGPTPDVLKIKLTCSSSHGTRAWSTGMYRSMRASKHSLRVRNIPRMSATPTSLRPLDCESYLAAFSKLICSRRRIVAAARSTTRASSARIAFSLSAFTIAAVNPSQQKSLTTRSTTKSSSSKTTSTSSAGLYHRNPIIEELDGILYSDTNSI